MSDTAGVAASTESVASGRLSASSVELQPLHVLTDVRLIVDGAGSGTEGSSFGSNCSSHALLNAQEPIQDPQQKMTI